MPTITAMPLPAQPGSPVEGVTNEQTNIDSGVSTPPEGTKPPEAIAKPEDALAPKYAQLAKQQRLLRQQQRATQEAQRALEAERKEIADAKDWKSRLTQDPYGVMLESGLTADQVATLMLNQPDVSGQKLSLLEQRLIAQENEIKQLRQGSQDAQAQNLEAAKKQILHDVKLTVDGNDTFEAIKSQGEPGYQAVVDLIEAVYNQEGIVMDTEEAITQIEDYLVEQAFKAAQLKKVQSRMTPAPQAETTQPAQKTQLNTQKTITNRMVQQPISTKGRHLSEAQRIANAKAVGQGRPKPYQ